MRRTAWVVLDDHGGDLDVADLPRPDVVVAADGGLVLCERLDLPVDLLVGDLDSAPADAVQRARARGVAVEEHPVAKDHTDLALALRAAVERTADGDVVVVVGGSGGRVDHALVNLLALADPALAGRRVRARVGGADVHVVRGEVAFAWPPGATATLVPVCGHAVGVTTTGLRYPLDDEDLTAGTTRGVSNVVDAETQSVAVRDGCVLAVLPAEESDP